jgi:Ni2+-binding GTPase involved in maturation of urease and hydrogenase
VAASAAGLWIIVLANGGGQWCFPVLLSSLLAYVASLLRGVYIHEKHGRMHCQSDCRGINKMVLMKMLNFERVRQNLVLEPQNENQSRSLDVFKINVFVK